jgi:hypothetical protein
LNEGFAARGLTSVFHTAVMKPRVGVVS